MHHKQDKNKQEEFKRYFNKIVNFHPKREVFFLMNHDLGLIQKSDTDGLKKGSERRLK